MTASLGMSEGRGGNGDCCAARLPANANKAIPVIFKEASSIEDSKRSTRHRRAHDKTSRAERGIPIAFETSQVPTRASGCHVGIATAEYRREVCADAAQAP